MKEIAKALYDFWNGFIKSYPTNAIPDNAALPYLVYNVQEGETLGSMTDFINLYYSGNNTLEMFTLADRIRKEINTGKTLKFDGGNIVIYKPDFQLRTDTETSIACYGSFKVDYNLN